MNYFEGLEEIFDKLEENLRDRYSYTLWAASGQKDPERIKLSKHMDNIKKRYQSELDAKREERANPRERRDHDKKALEFAKSAVKDGHKVRVKYPEGPSGSVYVRVGDKGTARFSDHRPPTEFTKDGKEVVAGGYSKTLKRRHRPATLSVHPKGEHDLESAKKHFGLK